MLFRDADGRTRYVSQYEAGRLTRRDLDYLPRGLGPNAMAELGDGGLDLAVRRSRDLYDNNPLVGGAVDARVDNIVSTGIDDLEPSTGFPDLDQQIDRLVEWAARAVDPSRQMSLADSQRLCQREIDVAGGVLVYYPMAEACATVSGDWPTMPAIELIEFERMPLDLSGQVPAGTPGAGNHVRQGIEVDALGRVVAFHVVKFHPKDDGWGSWWSRGRGGASVGWGLSGGWQIGGENVRRIPASEAHIVGRNRRIGELRNVPLTVGVTGTVRTEARYQETCMDQATLQASMGIFFEGVNPTLFANNPDALLIDAAGNPIVNITGMQVGFLPPGAKMHVASASLPGPTFEPTSKILHRRMSRGLRVPYSTLSGDASDTSYASMRGEQMDARSGYRPQQHAMYRRHTDPWRRKVIQWGLLTRRLVLSAEHVAAIQDHPERLYGVLPGYPAAGYVDPKAEASATMMDIQAGVTSPIRAIAERGGNWKDVVRERVKFAAELKKQMAEAGITAADLAVATAVAAAGGGAHADKGNDGKGMASDAAARESGSADDADKNTESEDE